MPKGYPKDKAVVTIDVPTRNGVRGRIEKLQREFLMKAEALRITADILDADERQQALLDAPKKFLQAMNHRHVNTPVADERTERKPKAERLAAITAFLREQPQAITSEVAAAVGIHGNRLAMLLAVVAKSKGRRGKEKQWVLRKNIARNMEQPMPRQKGKGRFKAAVNGNGNGHDARRPLAETQADIRAYLTDHPEAHTSEIAKALRRIPNSNFAKQLRTVARPARATAARQAIPWVLAEA